MTQSEVLLPKPHTTSGSQRLYIQGGPPHTRRGALGRANEHASSENMRRCSRSEHF